MKRPKFTAKVTRDTVLFVFGMLGVTYQTVVENADRPTLLILFAACMGLPVFLNADEKLKVPTAQTPPPAPEGSIEINPTEGELNPTTVAEQVEEAAKAEVLRILRERQARKEGSP